MCTCTRCSYALCPCRYILVFCLTTQEADATNREIKELQQRNNELQRLLDSVRNDREELEEKHIIQTQKLREEMRALHSKHKQEAASIDASHKVSAKRMSPCSDVHYPCMVCLSFTVYPCIQPFQWLSMSLHKKIRDAWLILWCNHYAPTPMQCGEKKVLAGTWWLHHKTDQAFLIIHVQRW